jgi:hypothetical protein
MMTKSPPSAHNALSYRHRRHRRCRLIDVVQQLRRGSLPLTLRCHLQVQGGTRLWSKASLAESTVNDGHHSEDLLVLPLSTDNLCVWIGHELD